MEYLYFQCSDGYYGNGTCSCEENFMGRSCDRCSQRKMFGLNCNESKSESMGYFWNGPSRHRGGHEGGNFLLITHTHTHRQTDRDISYMKSFIA